MRPENEEGRPSARAALRVGNQRDSDHDTLSVRHYADRPRDLRTRQPAHAALRTLRPADRARLLDRLAQLRDLERMARERGTMAA